MNQHAHPLADPLADADPSRCVIEPIDPELDVTPFRVRDPWSIVAELQAMASHAVLVNVYPPDGGPGLAGRIVELHTQPRCFVLEVERAHTPVSGRCLIVGQPQGIYLQFEADLDWPDSAEPLLQCTAELPAEIVHLQRRHFPRLDAPLGPVLQAEFTLHGKTRLMNVEDLSLGGLGLRTSTREGAALMRGQRLERVRLELGQSDVLVVQLLICSRRAYRSFLAGEQLHFGCRFIDLPAAVGETLQQLLLKFDEARRVRDARSAS